MTGQILRVGQSKQERKKAGKPIPPLQAILDDSDEEEKPDVEIQIPTNKVKLMVGPGGEKIKHIQRKSKCRIQVPASTASLAPIPSNC